MEDDFDLFSNIKNLDEILSKKPAAEYESPKVPGSPTDFVISDSPPRARGTTKALSKSSAGEMAKKGNQVMKRIQKKQEVVQKKTQKMMAIELSRNPLLNHSSSSLPRSRPSPSRRRARFFWGPRNSSDHESDYSYINIGSPPDTNSSFSGSASGSHSVSVSSMDLSSDIDYEVTIKLKWNNTIERIPYWQNKNFEELFKMLSERTGADEDRVFLMMNNSIVKPTDSPSSIGYTSVDFISGRVMDNAVVTSKKSKKSKTEIKLKIQSDRWKRPIIVPADKRDTVKELLKKCAQELKCSPDEISLRFDGDMLDQASTLQEAELEGGEILDCVFKGGR